jgi:hypothetical protein
MGQKHALANASGISTRPIDAVPFENFERRPPTPLYPGGYRTAQIGRGGYNLFLNVQER